VARLELGTVLLQWGTGCLLALVPTTRLRVLGTGYGWLVRGVGLAFLGGGIAATAVADGRGWGTAQAVAGAAAAAALTAAALAVSVARRGHEVDDARGFPPWLDALPPIAGAVALAGATSADGGPYALGFARLLVGAVFLGLVTDSMLLGHWYLVQPGIPRDPIKTLVRLVIAAWPLEVALLLVPTGMVSVIDGSIDDGYGGLLAWTWIVSALVTLGLALAARRELTIHVHTRSPP